MSVAKGVFEGKGMEFVLVLLVPWTSIFGAGDLARLVVLDVLAFGRAAGPGRRRAILCAKSFLHLLAEWHAIGSWKDEVF